MRISAHCKRNDRCEGGRAGTKRKIGLAFFLLILRPSRSGAHSARPSARSAVSCPSALLFSPSVCARMCVCLPCQVRVCLIAQHSPRNNSSARLFFLCLASIPLRIAPCPCCRLASPRLPPHPLGRLSPCAIRVRASVFFFFLSSLLVLFPFLPREWSEMECCHCAPPRRLLLCMAC